MNNSSRFLSIVGFVVLSAFCGVGIAWIVVGLLANSIFKTHADGFIAKSMPILLAGGLLGLIIGVVVAVRATRKDPETAKRIEKKYIRPSDRMRIYFGAPIFVTAISAFFFERLLRAVGTGAGAYIGLGVFLAIIFLSLFLYDRIPAELIIPIGIIGWLLTVLLAIGFTLYMLGVFRHDSAT
jgi:hypothetical protein